MHRASKSSYIICCYLCQQPPIINLINLYRYLILLTRQKYNVPSNVGAKNRPTKRRSYSVEKEHNGAKGERIAYIHINHRHYPLLLRCRRPTVLGLGRTPPATCTPAFAAGSAVGQPAARRIVLVPRLAGQFAGRCWPVSWDRRPRRPSGSFPRPICNLGCIDTGLRSRRLPFPCGGITSFHSSPILPQRSGLAKRI